MPSLILSPSASSNLESTVCDSWPDPCASFQCMCDRSFCLIDHSTTASIIIIIVVIIVVHVVRLFRSTNRSVISVSSSSGQWSFAFCTRVCDWEIQQHYSVYCVWTLSSARSICDRFGQLLSLVIKWWQNCNSIFVVNSTGGAVIYWGDQQQAICGY